MRLSAPAGSRSARRPTPAPATGQAAEVSVGGPPSGAAFWPIRPSTILLAIAIPGALALGARLSVIGGPPFTDEGIYAHIAQELHYGRPCPSSQGLAVYPYLASFVYSPDRPLYFPRLLDAFMAAAAAAVTTVALVRVSGPPAGLVVGALLAVAANDPVFCNAGFKNSVQPATAGCAAGLLLLTWPARAAAVAAGCALGCAVALREPFAANAAAVAVVAYALHGWAGVRRYVVGFACLWAAVAAWAYFARGPWGAIAQAYVNMGRMYEGLRAVAGDPAVVRLESARVAWDQTGWFLAAAAVWGLGGLALDRRTWRAWAAGAALAAPHVPEIVGKMCLPYHLAQLGGAVALVAAVGLGACGRAVCRGRRRPLGALVLAAGVAAMPARAEPMRASYRSGWELSAAFGPVMVEGRWDASPAVQASFYLSAADYLRRHSGPGDTVQVSGFYAVLYCLADRRPVNPALPDLTASTFARYQIYHPDLYADLRARPPTFVVETRRYALPLEWVWPDFGARYELVADFPNTLPIHYGSFGARVWKLRPAAPTGKS